MSKQGSGHVSKDAKTGRFVNQSGISKRGGESYKVTKSPPPTPPAPAIKTKSGK